MSDTPTTLPRSVLLMCNHNVIRSTMGEAILRKQFGERMFVDSAGIRAGVADPFVTAVLHEQGMETDNHEPKPMEQLDDTWFDLVIAFSDQAHKAVSDTSLIDYGELLYWPAGDPTEVQGSREQMLDAYRAVRDDITKMIERHFSNRQI